MKISVITPSFHQGKFIRRTVESVLGQCYQDKELVVFDGGSNDETVAILQSFGGALRWVSEPDRGQTHAINKGIQATEGEIIGWLNSDDVYHKGALAVVAEEFRRRPDIDVIYGEADHIDEDGRLIEPYPVEEWNFDRMKETCIICQPACFFRRKVVKQHGLLNEKLNWCMDYEYWLRLGKKGVQFLKIDNKLAESRMYADNKTMRGRIKVHQQINDVMKQHFGRVPERWIFNLAHYLAADKIDRNQDEKKFCRLLAVETCRAFWHWRTMPNLKSCIQIKSWFTL